MGDTGLGTKVGTWRLNVRSTPESGLSHLACKVLSIGDGILLAALCRTQAGALSDQSVDQSESRGDLREFCVNELCIVMHCSADWATGAPVTY